MGLRLYRIPFSTNVERIALGARAQGHRGRVRRRRRPADRSPVVADQRAGARAGPRRRRPHHLRLAGDPRVPRGVASRSRRSTRPTRRGVPRCGSSSTGSTASGSARLKMSLAASSASPSRTRLVGSVSRPKGHPRTLPLRVAPGRPRLPLRRFRLPVADCIAFPFLKYAVPLRPGRRGALPPHPGGAPKRLDARYPRLEAWIRRVDERPRA